MLAARGPPGQTEAEPPHPPSQSGCTCPECEHTASCGRAVIATCRGRASAKPRITSGWFWTCIPQGQPRLRTAMKCVPNPPGTGSARTKRRRRVRRMGKRSLSRRGSSSEGEGVVTHLKCIHGVSKHSGELMWYIGGPNKAREICCRKGVLTRGAKMGAQQVSHVYS